MTPRAAIPATMLLLAGICLAQYRPRSREELPRGSPGHFVRIEGGLVVNEDEIRTARETASHSSGTPDWTNAPGFETDVFTFTRIIFQSDSRQRFGRGRFS